MEFWFRRFFPDVPYYMSFLPMWWAVDQFFRENQRLFFCVGGSVGPLMVDGGHQKFHL